jgi:hypothetical protein
MNVGIGSEAAQFHFWEYINRIFVTVHCLLGRQKLSSRAPCEVAEFWWQYIFAPHSALTHILAAL